MADILVREIRERMKGFGVGWRYGLLERELVLRR